MKKVLAFAGTFVAIYSFAFFHVAFKTFSYN